MMSWLCTQASQMCGANSSTKTKWSQGGQRGKEVGLCLPLKPSEVRDVTLILIPLCY
jgi:hypothetical protein